MFCMCVFFFWSKLAPHETKHVALTLQWGLPPSTQLLFHAGGRPLTRRVSPLVQTPQGLNYDTARTCPPTVHVVASCCPVSSRLSKHHHSSWGCDFQGWRLVNFKSHALIDLRTWWIPVWCPIWKFMTASQRTGPGFGEDKPGEWLVKACSKQSQKWQKWETLGNPIWFSILFQ